MRLVRPTVCARLFGGVGNQMFIYAAARSLALRSGARLVLDTHSGFANDSRYRRTFQLAGCNLPQSVRDDLDSIRCPTGPERRLQRLANRALPFSLRRWIVEPKGQHDNRLTSLRPRGTVWLEGYWQDERYFADFADLIRAELSPQPPTDAETVRIRGEIESGDSIAVHLRLDIPPVAGVPMELTREYFRRALHQAITCAPHARVFAFSDNPDSARSLLSEAGLHATLVARDRPEVSQLADLWLMSRCRVLVLSPSTYSWWAACLTRHPHSVVIVPDISSNWDFQRLIRRDWYTIDMRQTIETKGLR
jgi:hypothetical protein